MRSRLRFDWDDLRFLLAVARHGSSLAASRALGVHASTVQRRLAELERCLGQPLLQRDPGGVRLNSFGQGLLPWAERMETAALDLQQRIESEHRSAAGLVRLTCPEPMVPRLTGSGLLERFHQRHPGLRVELVLSDRYLDLAKGEVDVALRSGDTDEADVVGRKIADSLWAVYASRDYAERHGPCNKVEDLGRHALVGLDDTMDRHRVSTWLREVAPEERLAARSHTVLGLVYLVKSGIGIGPLPTALGDSEPSLVRLFGPVPELTRIWRVLAHRDRRRTPGVSALFDFLAGEQDRLRPIFTG